MVKVVLQRDPVRLTRGEYDLLIIGGGIYGVCAALEGTRRGLRVALLERGDFGHATSANSLKLVHGGFRYIQHGDLPRIRESVQERRALLRIAPHLVHPLPFLVPTYGHGWQGKEVLAAALFFYNLLAFDRNRGLKDPERRIPYGRFLSRGECLEAFPAIGREGLTGALVFYDAQMYSPPRLLLSYLKSAVQGGADALNYVDVLRPVRDRTRVRGVRAKDLLTGDELEIRGKMVLNATGPWAEEVSRRLTGQGLGEPLRFSKDLYLVVNRRLTSRYALAVPSQYRDPNAIVSRGRRHLFLIPWRGRTLVGSSHVPYQGSPEAFAVTESDFQDLIEEFNRSYPAVRLTRDEVSFFHAGLVPMEGDGGASRDLRLARRYRILEHGGPDGGTGLVTVIGVRFTTARDVAEKAVDLVCRRLGRQPQRGGTAPRALYGGDIEDLSEFVARETRNAPWGLPAETMTRLLYSHGTAYPEVLEPIGHAPSLKKPLGDSTVLGAEVVHAIQAEMAQTLSDVVFRRTDLGTGGNPGEIALRECAALMARELGWDEARQQEELDQVRKSFP